MSSWLHEFAAKSSSGHWYYQKSQHYWRSGSMGTLGSGSEMATLALRVDAHYWPATISLTNSVTLHLYRLSSP